MTNPDRNATSSRSTENTAGNSSWRKSAALIAACALPLAGLVAKYGNPFDNDNENFNPKSQIVAGVPGQVEGHSARFISGVPGQTVSTWKYWLDIEQCPQDVDAANHHVTNADGSPKVSYDTKVGEYGVKCYVDYVKVSPDVYGSFADGAQITFKGNPTDALRK